MADDLYSNAGMAAIAYRDALTAAQNTQNALLRQYGFTMPNAQGQYSVEAAQTAFDPNTLFDQATGGINQARLAELAGKVQIGGTGALSDILRGGASTEAEAMLGARAAGLGGGGLAAQRRALAETQTAGQLGQAKQEFISATAQGLQPIGAAYSGLQQARIADRMAAEAARAAAATIPSVSEPVYATDMPVEGDGGAAAPAPAAGGKTVFAGKANAAGGVLPAGSRGNYKVKAQPKGNVPKNPVAGQTFTGKQGVNVVYRPQGPSGAGWYKKKK